MFVAVLMNKIGAQVLLFGSNEAWLQIGQKLGTAHSFNYKHIENTAQVVKELTNERGADVVIKQQAYPVLGKVWSH